MVLENYYKLLVVSHQAAIAASILLSAKQAMTAEAQAAKTAAEKALRLVIFCRKTATVTDATVAREYGRDGPVGVILPAMSLGQELAALWSTSNG